jgi:hypothetical protein
VKRIEHIIDENIGDHKGKEKQLRDEVMGEWRKMQNVLIPEYH